MLEGLTQGSFLVSLLRPFYEGLSDLGLSIGGVTGSPGTALEKAADKLRVWIEQKFQWELLSRFSVLGDDDDEDGPVVVELPEGYDLPE